MAFPLRRFAFIFSIMLLLALGPGPPSAFPQGAESAESWFKRGFAQQRKLQTLEALASYRKALAIDPAYGQAHYEIGWSYWSLGRWSDVVRHFELARKYKAAAPDLPRYLTAARERVKEGGRKAVRVPIGIKASGGGQGLVLVARFQNYNGKPKHPADRWERFVHSPKSVQISPDGARVFVQMLEGGNTVIFDGKKLLRLKVVSHRFGGKQAGLFNRAETRAYARRFRAAGGPRAFNRYLGKPVEGAFSHGGRFLWVTHYRRSFDRNGVMPSSVAIIDTKTEAIVRVMHTGPIPKFLAASPDGRLMAVVHWGGNTVGLIDVSSPRPEGFRHAGEIVVGRRPRLDYDEQVNRDHVCGFCLRGAVFTRDSRHLLVARMGGGGIAVLDVKAKRHLGTVFGMKPTPRHLILGPKDERVYLSSNRAGYVSAYRIADLLSAAKRKKRRLRPLLEKRVGPSIRTIAISPDGETLYATSFRGSKVIALRAKSLEKLFEIPADSYPVGIAVSPDGNHLWVTSQGYRLRGGNSVMVYKVLNKD